MLAQLKFENQSFVIILNYYQKILGGPDNSKFLTKFMLLVVLIHRNLFFLKIKKNKIIIYIELYLNNI